VTPEEINKLVYSKYRESRRRARERYNVKLRADEVRYAAYLEYHRNKAAEYRELRKAEDARIMELMYEE